MPGPGVQMHIDDVSRRMEAWLRESASGVDIAFVPDFHSAREDDSGTKPRIEICFQSIAAEKPDRALLNRDDAFLLTYLLRVTGEDALANQRVYSQIYFTAHESDDFKVGSPASRADGNAAGDLPGTPAILSLTARLVRPTEAPAPGIVMYPLDVQLRSLGHIAGKVVTEDGKPIMRADIDAPALDKRVVSDAAGRFIIPGAPAAGTVSLTVRVRSKSFNVLVDTEKQAEIVIVMPKENEHA